jgi:hypothetical protein
MPLRGLPALSLSAIIPKAHGVVIGMEVAYWRTRVLNVIFEHAGDASDDSSAQ